LLCSSQAASLRGVDRLSHFGRGRQIGQIEIRKRDRTSIRERGALGDVAGHIHDCNDGDVIGAGNVDGDVLGVGAAIAVVDGNGKHGGNGFACSEEIEFTFGDRVGPVNRAVVGVQRIGADSKSVLDRRLLCTGQTTDHVGRNGLSDLGRRWQIGQIEIGEGNRAGIREGGALGDVTHNIDHGDDG